MAKYPLGPLLAARQFREEAAARAARRARAEAEQAHQVAEAAWAEFQRYRDWRPGEEARRFSALRGQWIALDELDRHREDIQALRQAERNLEEAARRADSAAEVADHAAEAARIRQTEAMRDTRKIDEHRIRWNQEESRRIEAAEEAELEDFTVPATHGEEEMP